MFDIVKVSLEGEIIDLLKDYIKNCFHIVCCYYYKKLKNINLSKIFRNEFK